MGIKRVVDVNFWNDDKVIDYFSPEDKLFMLYLMTNPHTTQLGVYSINKKQMAFELGYSLDTINVLLDRFENKYQMIKYVNETKEIAIKNYLKYSIIKGGKPVEDLLEKEIKQVKDKSLLGYVYENIKDYENLNDTVKKVLSSFNNYITNDNDKHNDNDNDNDNDVSFIESQRYVTLQGTYRQNVIDSFYELKDMVLKNKILLPDSGDKECEWCGNKFDNLEKHHFPIPKRYNGKEIVNICHNCHKKFHDLEYKNNMGVYLPQKQDKFSDLENEFEMLWREYPKKQGKPNAFRDFKKARKNGVELETIINGLKKYLVYIKFEKIEQRYIKNGSTWFHQECWNDDYDIKRNITTNDFIEFYNFDEFKERGD